MPSTAPANSPRFLPDAARSRSRELVVTAVKALAHAGLKYLPGLVAQSPGSEFLQQLRTMNPGGAQFYALAADFEPSAKEWKSLVKEVVEDQIMDQVFQSAENDLVVPTLGVAGATGLGFAVPAERSFVPVGRWRDPTPTLRQRDHRGEADGVAGGESALRAWRRAARAERGAPRYSATICVSWRGVMPACCAARATFSGISFANASS
jgi:hypothetical protein